MSPEQGSQPPSWACRRIRYPEESCLFLPCWILCQFRFFSVKKPSPRLCVICHQRQLVTDRTMSSSKAVPAGHRKEAKPIRSGTEMWPTALGMSGAAWCIKSSFCPPLTSVVGSREAKRAECRRPSVRLFHGLGDSGGGFVVFV